MPLDFSAVLPFFDICWWFGLINPCLNISFSNYIFHKCCLVLMNLDLEPKVLMHGNVTGSTFKLERILFVETLVICRGNTHKLHANAAPREMRHFNWHLYRFNLKWKNYVLQMVSYLVQHFLCLWSPHGSLTTWHLCHNPPRS